MSQNHHHAEAELKADVRSKIHAALLIYPTTKPAKPKPAPFHPDPLSKMTALNISRSGLGVFISGILSIKLPWLLLSGAYNAYDLARNIKLLRDLKRALKSAGIHFKKRIIAKGLVEGAATKMVTTVLTLGHDEVAAGAKTVASWLHGAGSFMAEHVTSLSFSSPVSVCSVLAWDSVHRLNHSSFKETTDTATGNECVKNEHHWDKPGHVVAEQVLIVGAGQLGAEKVADVVVEKSYDRAEYEYRRKRDKIRAWFRR
ncbi:hypothetical protein HYQ45_013469 [Verticillium longisporum]|uniref:Uncharacterized protein n=1 Tax=Verticillium longisporum TaxID=100787 RepID=A0A8I2ZCF1_VERLO|nr:hypothetical protein HYQ45_013469 [Verticillium longisporum]